MDSILIMWMTTNLMPRYVVVDGVHSNGPSKIAESSEDLSTHIKNRLDTVTAHENGM
ncbi:hypothetical protein KIN20_024194 [Parelaphostrongylus tenuis]|uniref:Uncharacterized protein n=1 Tax=Parelaphostrongylus tenuis TaxID=148309 RepID=A0AAD5NCN9_PARTN|nr:hypothetical protein KIN20_024194 [Parelaphostrongylus tenuis]